MKRKLLYAVLLSCGISTAVAQSQYKDAWVITQSGDTLKGRIEQKNWNTTPMKISFRKEENSSSQSFDPFTIKEFSVGDRWYISATVSLEQSPRNDNALSEEENLLITRETVFLEKLIGGSKPLFGHRDTDGREQFFLSRGDSVEWLVYKRFLLRTPEASVIAYNNRYRSQLNEYLAVCAEIKSRTMRMKYELEDMIGLFRRFYVCSGEEPAYKTVLQKIKPQWGVLGGASYTSLSFKSQAQGFEYLEQGDFPSSVNPAGGVFYELFFRRRGNRFFSLENELMYSMYKTAGHYEKYETVDRYELDDTEFKLSYIKLNNMLRYNFLLNPGSRLFFGIGISNGLALSIDDDYRREVVLYGSSQVTEGKAIKDNRKYEQGFLFGGGYVYKKFGAEFRFERSNGMGQTTALKAVVNRGFLLLRMAL